MNQILEENITYLKGVGPQKAMLLASEMGIKTYGDLLSHYPYRYLDRSRFYKIAELNEDMQLVQLKGQITKIEVLGQNRKQRLAAVFSDGFSTIDLVWFKGVKWLKERLKKGEEYVIFGKPSAFNGRLNMTHPEIEEAAKFKVKEGVKLQAMYNTTEKMKTRFLNSKAIHQMQIGLLQRIQNKLKETLPRSILDQYKLMSLNEAIYQIHLPQSAEHLQKAQFRLKFEELFLIQLKILRLKYARDQKNDGFTFSEVGMFFNGFYREHIPFELTGAQKRVLREIRHDCNTGSQMNRLLQGDVGSGKTLVALMSMLLALDNGYQACLMAPTEILANQHYQSIAEMLYPLGVRVALLTGSTKQKERTTLHADLQNGDIQILIGTHALIEDKVQFFNLGLVVIDEQHRFGVAQRARLYAKNHKPPHVLVMTATPIPRTLAMTLYGDLEVSVIDELPPGRKPIRTMHYRDSSRLKVFGFLKKELALGRQVYIVYPLIQESEAMDYKDLEDGLESISRAFPAPDYGISVVHGKMKPAEKDKAMALFVNKQTNIMIATTVIEVGVNVPNASVMVIESAERFGLSQLHQLRGRVGRGADQSYCILMTGNKLSSDGRARIDTMVKTNDGFEISEVDLSLRGPGDLEGTQQSGIPLNLKIANLGKDNEILQFARRVAKDVLDQDPTLSSSAYAPLMYELKRRWRYEVDWSQIS